MIFDMDDFESTEEELIKDYLNIPNHDSDIEFLNSLMALTNMMKHTDYENKIKGGVDMLMRTINMSNIEEDDSEAMFVVAGLTAHIYKLISSFDEEQRMDYFNHFYEEVVIPLIEESKK